MNQLSKRLACVARYVPEQAKVADIGTDHAYLPLYLVSRDISPLVIAGEVNRKPYLSALETVRGSKMQSRVDVRLGDGLEVLAPGEVDVAVLAGMGGKTICAILSARSPVVERLKRLILQPMRDAVLVRGWLMQNGWYIKDEAMVYEDGHYYVIIMAEQGTEMEWDDFALKMGPCLLQKRDAVFGDYLHHRLREITMVLEKIQASSSREGQNRAALLEQEAQKIKEVLGQW